MTNAQATHCRACSGTGHTRTEGVCRACDGKGTIVRADPSALAFLALPLDAPKARQVLVAAIPGDAAGCLYSIEARPTGYAVHHVRGFERPTMLNDAAGRILFTTLDAAIARCEKHHADR
jgi:hypothetical protein